MPRVIDDASWTYSGDPGASDADALRFLIADTDPQDRLLSNGELAFLLKQSNNDIYSAALNAIQSIMGNLARCVDESVGSVSISFSQRLSNYQSLYAQLRARAGLQGGFLPYAGGLSYRDKQSNQQTPDDVKPYFKVHRPDEAFAPVGRLRGGRPSNE